LKATRSRYGRIWMMSYYRYGSGNRYNWCGDSNNSEMPLSASYYIGIAWTRHNITERREGPVFGEAQGGQEQSGARGPWIEGSERTVFGAA